MKLLICDKDGTLVRTKSGQTFVQHPEDQELIEGVADAIARYVANGWAIAIASNQGGVAAGFKTLEDAIKETRYALKLTGIITAAIAHSDEKQGYGECVWLTSHYYETVTHTQLLFRKPNSGMIDLLATNPYGNTLWRGDVEVLFVGDRPEDQGAAANAKVDFMWADEWRNVN